jgi:hypothetical protein
MAACAGTMNEMEEFISFSGGTNGEQEPVGLMTNCSPG